MSDSTTDGGGKSTAKKVAETVASAISAPTNEAATKKIIEGAWEALIEEIIRQGLPALVRWAKGGIEDLHPDDHAKLKEVHDHIKAKRFGEAFKALHLHFPESVRKLGQEIDQRATKDMPELDRKIKAMEDKLNAGSPTGGLKGRMGRIFKF